MRDEKRAQNAQETQCKDTEILADAQQPTPKFQKGEMVRVKRTGIVSPIDEVVIDDRFVGGVAYHVDGLWPGEDDIEKLPSSSDTVNTSASSESPADDLQDGETQPALNPQLDNPETPPENIKELPMWGLPKDLQTVVDEVAQSFQCHHDLVIASMLVASSTMIGKRVSCQFGEYKNFACLWVQLIAKSTSNKTSLLSFFFKPIELMEREAFSRYRQELQQWKSVKASERGDEPLYRHRLLADTSNENLLRELAINGDMCLYNDEFGSTVSQWSRYSKNGDDGFEKKLLSISNNKDTQVTRVHSEPLMLIEPNLNMIGGIQPEVFNDIMGGHRWEKDGFFQRFSYVFPEPTPIPPYQEPSISDNAKSIWRETIEDLDHYEDLDRIEPYALNETANATTMRIDAINRWRDEIRTFYNDESDLSNAMAIMLGKLPIHLCRWSIVVAVLSRKREITADVMRYSIECMEYFKWSGKRALRLIVNDGSRTREPTKAELIRYLKKINPDLTQQGIADVLKVTQAYVSRQLNR